MDRENNIYNLAPLISEYVFMWVKKFIEYELKMKVETRKLLTSSSSSTQLMKYLNNSVAVCEYFS